MYLSGRKMVAYADEKLGDFGYRRNAVDPGDESAKWNKSFDRIPGCFYEVILSIDTGKRIGARMALRLKLRLDDAFLQAVLPAEVFSNIDGLFGQVRRNSRKISNLNVMNVGFRKNSTISFELRTEIFDKEFIPCIHEFERAADVVAQSRETLRSRALDPILAPHPPGRIQFFEFRAAALLIAAWYGRDAFDEVVAQYRAAKDAGQWMKRAESDELVDRFVEVVYSVPEESWAAMRTGGYSRGSTL